MKPVKSWEKTQLEINSHPFYHHQGYKLRVTLSPFNAGCGTIYVNVECFVMKGEYDALLSGSFPITRFQITLIDKQEDSRQRRDMVISSNETSGTLSRGRILRVENDEKQYRVGSIQIKYDVLKERRYIVDDTIFIQIHMNTPR